MLVKCPLSGTMWGPSQQSYSLNVPFVAVLCTTKAVVPGTSLLPFTSPLPALTVLAQSGMAFYVRPRQYTDFWPKGAMGLSACCDLKYESNKSSLN